MRKIYAVVKPAYVGDSENPFVCIDLVAILWHRASYERICGYSLGHQAEFHANLDEAINSRRRRGYDGIIELDIDEQNQITAMHEIYYAGTQSKFVQDSGSQFFSKVKIPTWNRREVRADEMTVGAKAELQKQFNASGLANAVPVASAPPFDEMLNEFTSRAQPEMKYAP